MAGSLGYMAPEVARQKKSSTKSDVFSAGAIMFILCCGYPPFPQHRDQMKLLDATKHPNFEVILALFSVLIKLII